MDNYSLVQFSLIVLTGLSQVVEANSMINTAALPLIIVIILACEKWQKRLEDHGDFLWSIGRWKIYIY